jgi:hypothetical protein
VASSGGWRWLPDLRDGWQPFAAFSDEKSAATSPSRRGGEARVHSMTRDKNKTGGKKKAGPVTAAEAIAQLAQDPEFQRAEAERDAQLQARVRKWRRTEEPIVEDLHRVGVDVETAWDLVRTSEPYPAALPILMHHLELGGYPDRVLEGMARALAVSPAHVYWERLRDLYLRAEGRDEEEGLAAALTASAGSEHLDELLALLRDDSRGDSRIHLLEAVLRVGGKRGREVVESLRSDPLLGREASALTRRSTAQGAAAPAGGVAG